jgi:hypothetical protein
LLDLSCQQTPITMADPNQRLQTAVETTLDALEKDTLRPLRGAGFLCASKCCDSKTSNMAELQNCVSACQQKAAAAEQAMSKELQQFQERVQRCAVSCTDDAREKLPTDGSEPSPAVMASLEAQVNSCVNTCVDMNISKLSSLADRVRGAVKRM